MSKKSKREQYDDLLNMSDPARDAIYSHVKSIGQSVGFFSEDKGVEFNTEQYKSWCKANGFSVKLSTKDWGQRKKEQQYLVALSADQTLRYQKWRTKSVTYMIEGILKGELSKEQIGTDPLFKRLFELKDRPEAHTLLALLKVVERKGKFFDELMAGRVIEKFGHQSGNTYLDALVEFAKYSYKWVNPVEEWKPKTHNSFKQFCSLAFHLFGKYHVPEFLFSSWFSNQTNPDPRSLFIHLAQGGSVRTAPGLESIGFNKRQAHCFTQAPKWYNVIDAIKWAQVVGIGGDTRLVEAILPTRIAYAGHSINPFWMTVVQWLVNNPMLDPVHIGPIADYISNQKFTEQRVIENGVLRINPPPQPNFEMKGRTAEALLRQVEEWHGRLRRDKKAGQYAWAKNDIPEFEQMEGSVENKNLRIWSIKELCSSGELQTEGRAMHHCVSSYAGSCASGRISIWSLTLDSNSGFERCLTIEVTMNNKMIVQMRGKQNRLPTQVENRIVSAWAAKAGLGMSARNRM